MFYKVCRSSFDDIQKNPFIKEIGILLAGTILAWHYVRGIYPSMDNSWAPGREPIYLYQWEIIVSVGNRYISLIYNIYLPFYNGREARFLADPGKARGCSTSFDFPFDNLRNHFTEPMYFLEQEIILSRENVLITYQPPL